MTVKDRAAVIIRAKKSLAHLENHPPARHGASWAQPGTS
jgi:hypothetical protein